MKLPCQVIQDLLPLYHDDICGEETSQMVQEHLADCPACSGQLAALSREISLPQENKKEAQPLQAIARAWKKGRARSFIKGSLLALLICGLLFTGYYGLTRWKVIPVPADVLEVSQVSQLADGRLIYHLNVNDDKALYFVKFTTTEDGSYYMTPMRSLIERDRQTDLGLFNDYYLVDIAENNAWQQNHGEGIAITRCYLGPVGEGILIWEEGMDLPPASPQMEDMVMGRY